MGYERYKTLKFARPAPGVLEIMMGEEGKLFGSVTTMDIAAAMPVITGEAAAMRVKSPFSHNALFGFATIDVCILFDFKICLLCSVFSFSVLLF